MTTATDTSRSQPQPGIFTTRDVAAKLNRSLESTRRVMRSIGIRSDSGARHAFTEAQFKDVVKKCREHLNRPRSQASVVRPIRLAINGLGRIGRTILRQVVLTEASSPFQITHLNDICGLEMTAYLLRFDSVYGELEAHIETTANTLVLNGCHIPFTDSPSFDVQLSDTDILLDCTGKAHTREFAELGLRAGAEKVLISGPSSVADVTVVLGANEADSAGARIVSNASCTTNALAPLLKLLDQHWGLISAHMTTIHCYTGSQPMVDAPRGDMARSRAGALSMVPTTTSAEELVAAVLPEMASRLTGSAVRVPTASVSAIDIVGQFRKLPQDDVVLALRAIADSTDLIGYTEYPNVSADMRARRESVILALPETRQLGRQQLRIFGWYDNEWGFSARMLDMAQRLMTADTETHD